MYFHIDSADIHNKAAVIRVKEVDPSASANDFSLILPCHQIVFKHSSNCDLLKATKKFCTRRSIRHSWISVLCLMLSFFTVFRCVCKNNDKHHYFVKSP